MMTKNKHINLDYFHATWCAPCKRQDEELARRPLSSVHCHRRIDIDLERPDAIAHNISSIPTFILRWKNREIYRWSGFTTSEEIDAIINEKAALWCSDDEPETTQQQSDNNIEFFTL